MDSDKILSKIEARYKVMKNQNSDEDYIIWYHEEDVKKAIDLALTLNGVMPQLNTVGIDKDLGKSIDKLEKSDKFKRPTKKRF
jgi:hypothetical protein